MPPRATDSDDDSGDFAEGPGEHDAHLMDEAGDDKDAVACRECGETVWADAERCPRCGAYFAGGAWEGQVAGRRRPSSGFLAGVAVLMIVVILIVWVIAGG